MRSDFRSAMLGYMFDFKQAEQTQPGFEGFQKSAMSMIDLLDKPASEWDGPDSGLTYTKD